MHFPNNQQVALLLPDGDCDLGAIVSSFQSLCQAKFGWQFNIPEANPGLYYRLFGGREVMATFELLRNPGNPEVFAQALGSPFTTMTCPDMGKRVMLHRAMILITISHGVMGGVMNDPQFAGLFASIGMRIEGESLPEFTQRLELCALGARVAMDFAQAVAVHWTQSNMLLAPEAFETLAGMGVPSPLHVHPSLFGTPPGPGEEQALGVRTFGMRHFIGHEVIVEPTTLPWSVMWESAMVLLRVATVKNGYIIPDGDTFGDEDRSQSFRVRHLPADEGGAPLLQLTPLKLSEFDFVAPDYAPEENVIDDRMPPPALMPADDGDKMELANEWREKRAMAEGIGGRFEVRTTGEAPPPAAPPRDPGPPPISGTRLRARLFGRDRAA